MDDFDGYTKYKYEPYKAPQPAQQKQGDSICQKDDGCPTELAVLQRFWRGQPIPNEHCPAWFKPAPVVPPQRQEAQKQEPEAWRTEVKNGKLFFHIGVQSFQIDYTSENETEIAWMENQLQHALSKLASPPQRQPLTDEEIEAVRVDEEFNQWGISETAFRYVARAIEQAHGIKGEA